MENIIRVGIGVLCINPSGKILYGLRKSKHGENTYSPPGGHLEFGETIETCAVRELFEEAGIKALEKNIKIYSVLNEIYPNNVKHYINIITLVKIFEGNPINKEPHKLESWQWMSWDEIKKLGDKNFLPMQNFIKEYPDFSPLY